MKAFVCVYRHKKPKPQDWKNTEEANRSDPYINEFLDSYEASFFDWGDDPGFFSANKQLNTPCLASWGVCRRDVRKQLQSGDYIIWFCARENSEQEKVWEYYFIGCTTVAKTIDRKELWTNDQFKAYRTFYNTLAYFNGKTFVQKEVFYRHHEDWEHRIQAPYIIFDGRSSLSAVNLESPLLVATKGPNNPEEKNPELLAEIHAIMEPHSESESSLRTTLLYTNMTVKAVYDALVEKGWSAESLPTVRTISNILSRQDYRLRTVAKTKVQKKPQKPTQ
ncbi:MAG: ISAzo13-like element transposase-related protein, partial [Leptospirales bacterium]